MSSDTVETRHTWHGGRALVLAIATALIPVADVARGETLVFGPNEEVAASRAASPNGAPVVEITEDGVAHAVWVMGPMGYEGVFVASCPPGGDYGAATRLNAGGPPSLDYGAFRGPTLRSYGDFIVAGWKNRMSDAPEPIWAARSSNMGASWEPAVRADPGPVPGAEFRDFQAVATFPDGRIAQLWMSTDTGSGATRFDWSVEDGAGAFAAPVVATSALIGQPCECCYPDQIVLDDGMSVLVAFRGNDSNLRVVNVARSTDGGLSFPQVDMVDTTGWVINACPASGPSLAADGATVLATWMSAAASNHVYLARSTDGGATWSPTVRVDDLADGRGVNYPEVAIRGLLAVVVWQARRSDGGRGIFASASTDAGMTWGPSVLVNDDAGPADRLNPSVAIAPDSSVEVVWIDHRLGAARLFRARGRTTSAAGPNVLREKLTGSLDGAGPVIAAMLSDGVAPYRSLFGGSLPFADPEPVLVQSSEATLVFYAFDDPATPRIGVEKDVAGETVRILALP